PGLAASMETIKFAVPPKFTFSEAEVRLDDPLASKCKAKLLEPVDVTLDLDGTSLALTKVDLSADLREGVLRIPDLTLELLGGNGSAVIGVPLQGEPLLFDLDASVSGVQVREIAKLTNADAAEYLEGTVAANYAGKAGATTAEFNGGGALEINEAKLYKARFFGPLWDFLRRTATGLRGDQKQEVDLKYRLSENTLHADELILETALAQVLSKGSYDFDKDYISIDVRANFKGPVGLATAVASKALEIHGEGPMDDVKFGMKNQIVGGVVKGGAAVVREGVGVAREGAEVIKDGAGAIRDRAGDAAETLRPRNLLNRSRE
ncbi:MAG: AsmA-like C-terminal region-containing protein, partial [Verrucomicrobiota bacterium]